MFRRRSLQSAYCRSLLIFKERNDLPALADILVGHGVIACQQGNFDRAETLLNEALATAGTIQDPVAAVAATANALANLGVVARNRGEFESACDFHKRAHRIFLDHGDTHGAMRSLCDLGDLARDTKDFGAAITSYRACLKLLGDRGDTRVIRDAFVGTALVAAAWHRPESASRLLGAAEAVRAPSGLAFVAPADRTAAEQAAAIAEEALGQSGYHSALAAGRALSVSAAIREACALEPLDTARVGDTQAIGIRLSPRLVEVLHFLAAGKSDREIAESLFISLRTAEGHVAALLNKLGAENRSAAVGVAVAAGLIKSPSPPKSDRIAWRN